MTHERPVPWRANEVLTAAAMITVGFGLLLLGWWGSSGTPSVREQVAWLNVGVVGLMVIGVAHAIWLLHCRQAVGQRRRRLLSDFVATESTSRPQLSDATGCTAHGVSPVAVDGGGRFHRPDCQLVSGKPVRAGDRRRFEADGRRPCGMCRP